MIVTSNIRVSDSGSAPSTQQFGKPATVFKRQVFQQLSGQFLDRVIQFRLRFEGCLYRRLNTHVTTEFVLLGR